MPNIKERFDTVYNAVSQFNGYVDAEITGRQDAALGVSLETAMIGSGRRITFREFYQNPLAPGKPCGMYAFIELRDDEHVETDVMYTYAHGGEENRAYAYKSIGEDVKPETSMIVIEGALARLALSQASE